MKIYSGRSAKRSGIQKIHPNDILHCKLRKENCYTQIECYMMLYENFIHKTYSYHGTKYIKHS